MSANVGSWGNCGGDVLARSEPYLFDLGGVLAVFTPFELATNWPAITGRRRHAMVRPCTRPPAASHLTFMAAVEPAVAVENLVKVYNTTRAVDGISFALAPG